MIHRAGRSLIKQCANARLSLPALCLWLLLANPASAQNLQRSGGAYTLPPGSMPPWTVPVLKLVSSTHVEPTTGIVISDTGLVLVPEDFARIGDEIIVLDGGTDIIRNGRPARIERKFTVEGVQVLLVEGLRRTAVPLAAGTLEEGSGIVLAAFPPAEQIAQGEPPLSIPASVVVFAESDNPAISSDTALPNVTGALVDSCGNLVGISIADDVQSMESSPATRYQWGKTLRRIFSEMQISPREMNCSAPAEVPADEPVVETPEPEEAAVPEAGTPEEAGAGEPPEDAAIEEALPAEDESEDDTEELLEDILPPVEHGEIAEENIVQESAPRRWPWLLAALLLFGLGFILHRLRKSWAETTDAAPETAQAEVFPQLQGDDEPEAHHPLLDSRLVIRGNLANGTAIEDSCPVSEHAINVMIGRGDTDLKIDSPAVSRQHVHLNGTLQELTVSDLGSSNGTSINGVPCLEGEIMFIEPGDTLVLGDARITIEIAVNGTTGSGKE